MSWWGRKPTVAGAWEETDHAMQWDETLDADGTNNPNVRPNGSIYVEASAADIRSRVDELVDLYFPIGMTPTTMSFTVAPTPLNATTVTITAATVTAASPPVQYYFTNPTNNTNRGWSHPPTWPQHEFLSARPFGAEGQEQHATQRHRRPEPLVTRGEELEPRHASTQARFIGPRHHVAGQHEEEIDRQVTARKNVGEFGHQPVGVHDDNRQRRNAAQGIEPVQALTG